MNLTRDEVALLKARQARRDLVSEVAPPVPGAILTCFVAGVLLNPLNASAWMWQKRKRWAEGWKRAVANVLLEHASVLRGVEPATPKVVQFRAYVGHPWDDDAVPAGLKPVRDALVECRVVHSDAPGNGHRWEYTQATRRGVRGVAITVWRQAGQRGER